MRSVDRTRRLRFIARSYCVRFKRRNAYFHNDIGVQNAGRQTLLEVWSNKRNHSPEPRAEPDANPEAGMGSAN